MEAFAGERIEESSRVADEQPALAVPPRDSVAERGRSLDRVAALGGAPVDGIVAGRRDGREHGLDGALGAVLAQP